MELDQLFQSAPYLRETTAHIQPFDLDILGQAFQLRETAPIDLPSVRSISLQWLFVVFPITRFYERSSVILYRQKKEYLQFIQNQKASPRTRTGSIKSTRKKIRKKTESIRSTSTVTKIGVKTKRRKRIKVDIMILVVITQRNIMRRSSCCLEFLYSNMADSYFSCFLISFFLYVFFLDFRRGSMMVMKIFQMLTSRRKVR